MKIDWQIYFSISVLQFVKNVVKLTFDFGKIELKTKQKYLRKIAEIIFHFMYYISYFYPNVETKVRRVCIVVSKVHRWNYSKIRAAPEKSDYDR